jgi:hypothetical protein
MPTVSTVFPAATCFVVVLAAAKAPHKPARNCAPGLYSKLVAAPTFDASHLSKAAWLSTVRNPPLML